MPFESMLVIGSLLLVASGGAKWVDGGPTSGALRAARLPSSQFTVRLIASIEVVVGVAALVVDHPAAPLAVAGLYGAFAGFVAWALWRRLPIQSCGCFGRSDTPPTPIHLAVNLALAGSAALASGSPPWIDGFATDPFSTIGVFAFATIGVYLLYLILAELPATLAVAGGGRR